MFHLSKTFRFEAAHRLTKGFKGKCMHIHGHSWNGSVTVSATELDRFDFGLEYSQVKALYLPQVESWDHTILLHDSDLDLIELCEKNKWRYHTFPDNPTSEVIARHLFKRILNESKSRYGDAISLVSVTIEETCTSKCVYYG